MSQVKVMAIEPCNSHRPGDTFMCSEREAKELEALGLVKMSLGAPQNKMRPDPENQARPTRAAGVVAPSSASPAAPASPQTIAQPSTRGNRSTPRRGRR